MHLGQPAGGEAEDSLDTAQQLYDEAMSERDSDASYAAELFSRALEIRNRHHGETALENADTYLRYGVSLFEAARDERTHETLGAKAIEKAGGPGSSSAAGAASSGVGASKMFKDDPEDSSASGEEDEGGEGDDVESEEAEADESPRGQGAGGSSDPTTAPSEATTLNTYANGAEEPDHNAAAASTSSVPVSKLKAAKHRIRPGASGGKSVEDMDLAYEVLEAARTIYMKDGEEKHAAPLALLYRTIGEIKGEEGNFDASVEDLLVSIQYQHKVPPSNPRRLAELHFLLSKILQMADRQSEAAEHCEEALSQLRSASLQIEQELLDAGDVDAADDDGEAAEKAERALAALEDVRLSMEDLKEMAQELREAVEMQTSMKDALKGFMKAQQKQADQKAAASGAGGSGSSSAPLGSLPGSVPAAPAAVQDLGTVGRGKTRITLQPVSSSISPSPPPPSASVASSVPIPSSLTQPSTDVLTDVCPVPFAGMAPESKAESPLACKAESPLASKAESPLGSKRSLTDMLTGGAAHHEENQACDAAVSGACADAVV